MTTQIDRLLRADVLEHRLAGPCGRVSAVDAMSARAVLGRQVGRMADGASHGWLLALAGFGAVVAHSLTYWAAVLAEPARANVWFTVTTIDAMFEVPIPMETR